MKTFVFKKQFLGNQFVQVTSDEEYRKLDSDEFYNKLYVADESENQAIVYVPVILGSAEQVQSEFIEWLYKVGRGEINPLSVS